MRKLGYFALIGMVGCAIANVAMAQSPGAASKPARTNVDPNALAAVHSTNASAAAKPLDVRISARRDRSAEGIYAAAKAARSDGLTATKADRTAVRAKLAEVETLRAAPANRHEAAAAATVSKAAPNYSRRRKK